MVFKNKENIKIKVYEKEEAMHFSTLLKINL